MVLRNPAFGGTSIIPWRGKIKPPFEITFSALNIKRLVGVRLLLFYYILSKNES